MEPLLKNSFSYILSLPPHNSSSQPKQLLSSLSGSTPQISHLNDTGNASQQSHRAIAHQTLIRAPVNRQRSPGKRLCHALVPRALLLGGPDALLAGEPLRGQPPNLDADERGPEPRAPLVRFGLLLGSPPQDALVGEVRAVLEALQGDAEKDADVFQQGGRS